jgi:phosphoserine phosphatase RsbU/P
MDAAIPMRGSQVRIWLVMHFIALPGALFAQPAGVPMDQCVYRLGDNPAWSSINLDESGWKPYNEYRMTGDAYVLWIRCRDTFDTNGIQHPALMVTSSGSAHGELFFDGNRITELRIGKSPFKVFPIALGSARSEHIVAARIFQQMLWPGLSPGGALYLFFGDAPYMQEVVAARVGDGLRGTIPTYSGYLLIGSAGLFLLGLFLYDRSQKAAFWLGIYCCCVDLPRINIMLHYLFRGSFPDLADCTIFGLAMFESWALVRVCFALARRRVPAIYWVVFAAWIFIFLGSVLPVFLPAQLSLPLSLFVQVTAFRPNWCIWGFACTAPFVAFWPWTQLRGRLRIVASLCAVWSLIEGWFQLQQVIFNRNTWTGPVQTWMSLAVGAMVIALFGYIFHQQQIAADERAELRGELTAARQVQHLLIPGKTCSATGVTVNAAFLPAHEVGGDFYLCRALPNGAQRVLLGDVSGKGVAAALTSALLLGAADRCDDLCPPAVLKELNSALRNSGISGFTTCLCADLQPGGILLVANAGQLPPYRNGREIEVSTGLPLGIDAAADYTQSSLQLDPGDTLTFLSDGVVEARNATGELFGFERTREISSRPAQQIANAAVEFGQQDDITVLTLSFAPSPVMV